VIALLIINLILTIYYNYKKQEDYDVFTPAPYITSAPTTSAPTTAAPRTLAPMIPVVTTPMPRAVAPAPPIATTPMPKHWHHRHHHEKH